MKIRNGFVSNSSSSSFLVAFPSIPKSVKDVQEMVFQGEQYLDYPYPDMCDVYGVPERFTAEEVSEIIWNDIKSQIPNNRNMILNRMHSVTPDYKKYYRKIEGSVHPEFDYDEYRLDNKEIVQKFINTHTDRYLYCMEYSDNGHDSIGVAMEHGNLFERLPHLVSSNH
jgi:hypothetical protein